ncbi:hypothetical protein [Synoicihabitans lomoniglobus]|uniref:Lipoprotein n=1 Tax=Synoicihabitans lomoniglobus TaxID=2909285 RepID=A0AAF0A1G7_9BACT|nr:hypothetical protein [Opitutaceae bacterium LMO-M01]WED65002.1 hypothetical protein PXH66_21855 [Opitutaceae bacterium LMO-M01]
MNTRQTLRGVAVATAWVLLVSGCAVINSHQDSHFSGNRVSTETLNKVQPGVTTESWLVATLGEPSRKDQVDPGTKILRYTSKHVTRIDTELLLVLDTSSRKEDITTVFFEIQDGVLSRYWSENEKSSHRG